MATKRHSHVARVSPCNSACLAAEQGHPSCTSLIITANNAIDGSLYLCICPRFPQPRFISCATFSESYLVKCSLLRNVKSRGGSNSVKDGERGTKYVRDNGTTLCCLQSMSMTLIQALPRCWSPEWRVFEPKKPTGPCPVADVEHGHMYNSTEPSRWTDRDMALLLPLELRIPDSLKKMFLMIKHCSVSVRSTASWVVSP